MTKTKRKICHSAPAWILGPRKANPKFGGTEAGILKVKDRLEAVQGLSKKLSPKLLDRQPLLSSGHTIHEIKSELPAVKKFNSPHAVSKRDLKRGIRSGQFPRILAVTAPAFGFPGAEEGCLLHASAARRKIARECHIEAITLSQELQADGLGEGVTIWWPANDALVINPPRKRPLGFEDAWRMLVEQWVEILTKTGRGVWLEWKPGDPGIDVTCTLALAVQFAEDVNLALGRKAMMINNEWAHVLASGITVADATWRTIKACLFSGFCHANSGQILPFKLEERYDWSGLAHGPYDWEEVPVLSDWDWLVGQGGIERAHDQEEAAAILLNRWEGPLFLEHDIHHAGVDPIKAAEQSIRALDKMLRKAVKAV